MYKKFQKYDEVYIADRRSWIRADALSGDNHHHYHQEHALGWCIAPQVVMAQEYGCYQYTSLRHPKTTRKWRGLWRWSVDVRSVQLLIVRVAYDSRFLWPAFAWHQSLASKCPWLYLHHIRRIFYPVISISVNGKYSATAVQWGLGNGHVPRRHTPCLVTDLEHQGRF